MQKHGSARSAALPAGLIRPGRCLMNESDFDWNACYVIPAGARFRSTPAGALQMDGEGADDSAEVPREWVELRCQLPLQVPGGCKLKVGDQEVEQQEGRCIVFDDSFLHSAWNDSGEARFVLVFDFFHPDLTVPEIVY